MSETLISIMLIFIYGKDSYRAARKLREITEHYKKVHKTGLNFKSFEGKEFPFEDFENESKTSSMFKEKKLVVLKNIFSDKKNQEKFLKILKGLGQTDDIILIFEEGKPDSRTLLYKFLKKHSKSQEFEPLKGARLKKWLRDQFTELGADITQEALDKLILSVGSDSWQLSKEAEKLASFKMKDKVEAEDIDLLVKPRIETDIFRTIDAIAQKKRKTALVLIHKHLEKGDNPLYLLAMINFQFRNLLVIKDLIERNQPYHAIQKVSGLHPFVVRKSYQQAGSFSLEDLKKIYQKIFEADLAVKRGKMGAEAALDLLLSGLI